MKKLMVLGLVLPLCAYVSRAGGRNGVSNDRSHNVSITMNDDSTSDDCRDHLRVNNDNSHSNVRDEESKTISNQPLTITAEHNGGIQVTTWDKPEISLKLCKQAATSDENEGRKLLAETHMVINGSNISIQAPERDSAHQAPERDSDYSLGTVLLVKAPKNANLNLHVQNGGISLNRFTGTAEAHAQNGGISFQHSDGKLTAEAQNGGVSIKDCAGEVNAQVQNGGLSIVLPEHWEGKGLEAHAHNGGMVVSLPRNFNGGLEVSASEYTTILCKDEICSSGERTWDNGHKLFRMGGANPQVRASTENGGIIIKERGRTRDDE